MNRALVSLKEGQQFIFLTNKTDLYQYPESKFELLNTSFSQLQNEAFGKQLLKLGTDDILNFDGDPLNKAIIFDPLLAESILKDPNYKDPNSLLVFIMAHELSHFIQDFIALKTDSVRTVNNILLASNTYRSLPKKLALDFYSELKKIGVDDLTSEKSGLILGREYCREHAETDAYAYILLQKLNYKLPEVEDLQRIILKITKNSSDEIEICSLKLRLNTLKNFRAK